MSPAQKAEILKCYAEGNLELALTIAKSLEKDYPDERFLLKAIGTIEYSLSEFNHAEEYLSRALNLQPNDAETRITLALAYRQLNKFQSTQDLFAAKVNIEGLSFGALVNLASLLRWLRQYRKSLYISEKIVALNPKQSEAHANLCKSLMCVGDLNAASRSAKTSVELAQSKNDFLNSIELLLDAQFQAGKRDSIDETLSEYRAMLWSTQDDNFDSIYCSALLKTKSSFSPSKRRDRFRSLVEIFDRVSLLEGMVAECGCFKGLSTLLLCLTMQKHDPAFKGGGFQIFDSFEGLSEPSSQDLSLDLESTDSPRRSIISKGSFSASLDKVKKALEDFDGLQYFKGWIPTAFPVNNQARYKFVHVDVDLYQPTIDSFRYFWPLMVEGGIIVSDDYNWPGAKKAIKEFVETQGIEYRITDFNQAYFVKSHKTTRAFNHFQFYDPPSAI